MSYYGLDRDTVNIKRLVITQGPAGGQVRSYTAAKRTTDGVPLTWKCRAQTMTVEEETRYGVRDDSIGWKFLGGNPRPEVDTRDQFDFEDNNGVTHEVRIKGRERDLDNQGKVYQVMGEEVFGES